jgi:hypothetical protein
MKLLSRYAPRLACCAVTLALTSIASAQSPGLSPASNDAWSTPITISSSSGYKSKPLLLEGFSGVVHGLWIENLLPDPLRTNGHPEAVVYSRYDGQAWSTPTDVIVAPSAGRISDMSAVLDETNRIHLLLIDGTTEALLYTSAKADEAARPQAWLPPMTLSFGRIWNSSIDFAPQHGSLNVIYTLHEAPYEVYFSRSDDLGLTWSRAVEISSAATYGELSGDAVVTVDTRGHLHAIWAQYELPTGYPPLRIMYTRSDDQGETWQAPMQLQDGHYGNPGIVVRQDGRIYVMWNGAGDVGGRYLSFSDNAGRTWSQPNAVGATFGGLTGAPAMALDSAGILHFASSSGTGGEINGIAYARWDDTGWTVPLNVSRTYTPYRDEQSRQGYEPFMASSEGNNIHLVYLGQDHREVYYVATRSEAEHIALPTVVPHGATVPPTETKATAVGTPLASANTPVAGLGSAPQEFQSPNPMLSVLAGAGPAVILLVAVIALKRRR